MVWPTQLQYLNSAVCLWGRGGGGGGVDGWVGGWEGGAGICLCPCVCVLIPVTRYLTTCDFLLLFFFFLSLLSYTWTKYGKVLQEWWASTKSFHTYRPVGLVVKASASGAEDLGFESRLRRDFPGSSHTSDLKIGTPVATLPGARCYRVIPGTGRPGISIL